MTKRISVDVKNHVARVTLDRPEKMNAIDQAMFEAIIETGEALAKDGDVRAVVLHGEGRAFCAGLDMQNFAGMMQQADGDDAALDGPSVKSLSPRTHGIANTPQQAVWVWRTLPVPVVAAVHGTAFGGGFQLALGADIRIVAPDTKLSILEIKWGLIPDMCGIALMRHLAPEDIIRELTYTGRIFSGVEAKEFGFATRVSNDPLVDAITLAEEIASRNPLAVEAAKGVFNRAPHLDDAETLMMESVEQEKIALTPHQRESIAAGLQKRPAKFPNTR